MKKFFLSLFVVCGVTFAGMAQCASGSEPCTVDNSLTEPGLYPSPDSIACIVAGEWTDITVQLVNFDSAEYNGIKLRVNYLIIDSIANLPCGIKWTTSKQDADTSHRFENQEKGCIRFYGITNDPAGQYKLGVHVRAGVIIGEVDVTAEEVGLRVDVRVIASAGDNCPNIDTTSSATLLTATCTNGPKDTCFTVGINEISNIDRFTFYPNPVSSTANISFIATESADYTATIVNVYGQEVVRETLNVTTGLNNKSVSVANLPAGVYIYTITDGKAVSTHRFVVQ